MTKIFYTSDTHFDHENIIRFSNRPFRNASHMNRELISNWNSVVGKDDIVYHLGDFSFSKDWRQIFERLNGEIHLIIGNHDRKHLAENRHLFASVKHADIIRDENRNVWLAHYPITERPPRHYAVYGHVHNNTDWPQFNYLANLEDNYYYLNAGVDINNYTPATLEQLVINNEIFRIENDANH